MFLLFPILFINRLEILPVILKTCFFYQLYCHLFTVDDYYVKKIIIILKSDFFQVVTYSKFFLLTLRPRTTWGNQEPMRPISSGALNANASERVSLLATPKKNFQLDDPQKCSKYVVFYLYCFFKCLPMITWNCLLSMRVLNFSLWNINKTSV